MARSPREVSVGSASERSSSSTRATAYGPIGVIWALRTSAAKTGNSVPAWLSRRNVRRSIQKRFRYQSSSDGGRPEERRRSDTHQSEQLGGAAQDHGRRVLTTESQAPRPRDRLAEDRAKCSRCELAVERHDHCAPVGVAELGRDCRAGRPRQNRSCRAHERPPIPRRPEVVDSRSDFDRGDDRRLAQIGRGRVLDARHGRAQVAQGVGVAARRGVPHLRRMSRIGPESAPQVGEHRQHAAVVVRRRRRCSSFSRMCRTCVSTVFGLRKRRLADRPRSSAPRPSARAPRARGRSARRAGPPRAAARRGARRSSGRRRTRRRRGGASASTSTATSETRSFSR